MKNSAQVSYLRQLCCLGLGGQIIMPDVMRALHGIIPSSFNNFLWADENYQTSAVLCEETFPELETLYFKEYHNSKEADALKTTFSQAMRRGRDWVNSERLGQGFLASELFNNVIKPAGIRHMIEATICVKSRGVGSMVLNRAPGEKPFSHDEEIRLRNLTPYIAYGLQGSRDLRGEITPSGNSGMLVVDHQHKIVEICPEGRRLMLLAMHPGLTRFTLGLDSSVVKHLCVNLRGILQGRCRPVPVFRQRNAWGEFLFRGYPLSIDGQPDGLIGIVIEHHEPSPLKLMRNMRELPLTARQREVCLLLSYGYTRNMIGPRMHVSNHTAIDYVRKIYDKLDVSTQGQLIKKLMNIAST
ncbi:helix-turn-helix transcriptional regulator [Sulfuriferula sp.]|uniref:helix-turn-helix transcriptional regulator n=1 Tax=Sulfuriferula sp. TaxID=2025307 RepID=UPI00272FAC71|nr:helix-turn-helix transcriptional regulator [Sulfuriferula sp.]MDP2026650.1 helix-turn-helix transcriptional regulator [Sulfuriferula sp.]